MPRSADEACALRAAHPDALPVAGATAAQLAWPQGRAPALLLDLGLLVRAARERPTGEVDAPGGARALELSAFAPLETLRRDPLLGRALPALAALIGGVGAAPVRRLGTLGGNLCWPAGDLRCAMLALDATGRFARGGERALHDAPGDDLLVAVRIPLVARLAVFEKVGYRAAFSPSLVTVAVVREAGGFRVAAGGGVTVAQRLPAVEALAQGPVLPPPAALRAAVESDLHTGDDPLASAAERRAVAARVIAGHLAALHAAGAPT